MPSSCDGPADLPVTDSIETGATSRSDLLPESTRKPYVYKLIRAIVDHGDILDIKPRFARADAITCLAHRRSASASWPISRTGSAASLGTSAPADGGVRFIQSATRFNIPPRVPARRAGLHGHSRFEHAGIIRRRSGSPTRDGAATVPKITCVVRRRRYGAGYCRRRAQ